ncbi:hypothetical protein ABVN80_14105 [Acinetobacter baumannii]
MCCLALTACATTAPLSSYPQAQVLEQDTNIEAYPTTTGNVAKLIKHDKQACMIEFTGYLGGGQVTEHWIFNNKGLISAQSFTKQYPDSSGILSQATNSTTKALPLLISKIEIQNNFKKLQSNFSKDNLAKCD